MSYADIPEIRNYLEQIRDAPVQDPQTDVTLQEILGRATSMIDTYLGFSYGGYTSGTKVVYGGGSPNLTLPPHQQGTVTIITPEGGTPVVDTTWTEQEDGSVYLDASHVPYPAPYASLRYGTGWGFYRYTVTALWGYGLPPESVKEVCLELAMNIWKQKDKGFVSDYVGVTGTSGQRFSGGLPRPLRDILEIEKAKWGKGLVIA